MKLKVLSNKLKILFQSKPAWYNKPELTVKPAFSCGGIQYFEIPGVFNIPYQRGLAAADIYEEVQMRVTREYLLAHTEQMKELISGVKSIDLLKIVKLYNELNDRVNWIVSPETIYKLASVVYFDESESPYEYNFQYAQEKIANWKKYKVKDFFLQEPIRKFIPHSDLQEEGLINYIQTAMKVERQQSEDLLQELSKANWTKEFYKTLKSYVEVPLPS